MPMNALTAQAGLRIGPVVLETLVKHYFERLRAREGKGYTHLREEEMLYDQAFGIVRAFMQAASHHTVEEVQAFANTWTPSPPWVHVIRLTVPISCCNDAANVLIQAFGGEESTRRILGGVKWWQVRGLDGVDAQWITARKDLNEAKRRYKQRAETAGPSTGLPISDDLQGTAGYGEEMDEMRCILYSHGGGYYFGSVDQERYSIQRYARKINGRVFAINYRLAPQYPFPCAIHDLLAAYLYLIRPPPGASHKPVKPSNIVIAGDSAGGGMSLSLLQIIRDTGLPAPAGGVLISPWCDLTHSFPSIHTNTDTDIVPPWGLCLQKPSPLWPPPSEELAVQVRTRLRSRVRHALHMSEHGHRSRTASLVSADSLSRMPVNVGPATAPPRADPTSPLQKLELQTETGEMLVIESQVQLYAQNSMLNHPLISPALSYLGGLPPLFFIAGDKEVLRDEIIYAAHKAARPDKFQIKEEYKDLYPPLDGIERRHKPTQVHLQVYDDSAHVLPVLFSFTTPAKFCYRAIASFIKQVARPDSPDCPPMQETENSRIVPVVDKPEAQRDCPPLSAGPHPSLGPQQGPRKSLRRSLSVNFKRATSTLRQPRSRLSLRSQDDKSLEKAENGPQKQMSVTSATASTSSDVAGPRFTHHNDIPHSSLPRVASVEEPLSPRFAGDASVYEKGYVDNMIRERVSTHGEIRPLELESGLDAFKVPEELVGAASELAMRRYIDAKAMFDKKYFQTAKRIEKQRKRTLERAQRDTSKTVSNLQTAHQREKTKDQEQVHTSEHPSRRWDWAWLVEGNEHPPPSSITARRDTDEARRLALIADEASKLEPKTFSANNLWSIIVDFLTVTPDSNNTEHERGSHRLAPRLSHFFSSKKRANTAQDNEQGTSTNSATYQHFSTS